MFDLRRARALSAEMSSQGCNKVRVLRRTFLHLASPRRQMGGQYLELLGPRGSSSYRTITVATFARQLLLSTTSKNRRI